MTTTVDRCPSVFDAGLPSIDYQDATSPDEAHTRPRSRLGHTALAARMPNLRRTGPLPWKPLTALSGPTTLPVNSARSMIDRTCR
ncbi:hypothetical protein BH09ACT8_BH09ACT8_49520 [soil metagenome]